VLLSSTTLQPLLTMPLQLLTSASAHP
jgi:hypothetical protein